MLIKALFGSELVSFQRLRWYLGTDGWVEDAVLKLKNQSPQRSDLLDDPVLRDQVALLDRALFGTSYGGDLETIDGSLPPTKAAANIHVSARELSTWLEDNQLTWHRVEELTGSRMPWSTIRSSGTSGTYASDDGSMIMLTFPTTLLAAAQRNPNAIETLRIPFRQFAVASESVFGGVWTNTGQIALLARVRTKPFNILPPLRFETFALLAGQSTDELSQSYEGKAIFAGKLQSGEYPFKHWAPAYLSAPLIDTQLGALLNITDQMLKSWSQAGRVEYLYFTYLSQTAFRLGAQHCWIYFKRKVELKAYSLTGIPLVRQR